MIEQDPQSNARKSHLSYNELCYVHIALILRRYLSINWNLSGLQLEPGRGEVEGFDEVFVDTIFLRCVAR